MYTSSVQFVRKIKKKTKMQNIYVYKWREANKNCEHILEILKGATVHKISILQYE